MKNVKKPVIKLMLSKETLRRLNDDQLKTVGGGDDKPAPTPNCTFFTCAPADNN